jgi:membrane associated rhomboid family serine protease
MTLSDDVAEAIEFYLEHPYLELDSDFSERVLPDVEDDAEFAALLEASRALAANARPDRQIVASEQQALDEMVDRALRGFRRHPLLRWGLTPAAISPLTLLTHMFLHAGWLHLLGNLLILYLAGPFIEDVWGRPVFAGFYVISGLVAALAFIAVNPDSTVPMIGASGAIAGVMGAFLIRYRTTRIRFFYMVGFFIRGTFSAAAWIMLPLWFGQQLFMALMTGGGGSGEGVAYWAHVGGFAVGVAAATLVEKFEVEQRWIAPQIEGKISETLVSNEAVERALEAQAAGDAERAFEMLAEELRRAPHNHDAAVAFWIVAVELERPDEAAPALLRVIQRELGSAEVELALSRWSELESRCKHVDLNAQLALRLAHALDERQHRDEAAATLRRALLAAGSRPGAALALRIAALAAEVDPAVARAAARLALEQEDLGPEERVEATRLLDGSATAIRQPVKPSVAG